MGDRKLLPCPFCGSAQVGIRGGRPSAACPRVQCSHCGARGPEWLSSYFGFDHPARAELEADVDAVVEAWNLAPRRDGTRGGLFPFSRDVLRKAIEQERAARAEPIGPEDLEMLEQIKAELLGKLGKGEGSDG